MLLEAPSEAAEEIELAFLRLSVLAVAGKRVIAGAIKMRTLQWKASISPTERLSQKGKKRYSALKP